jgi:hypothetical protein
MPSKTYWIKAVPKMTSTQGKTKTTTVRLPRNVYDQAKHVVETERRSAQDRVSLNDFFVAAIKAYLKMYRRRQIDAAFAGMADDAEYQREAKLLAEGFAFSDWQALGLKEKDLEGGPV